MTARVKINYLRASPSSQLTHDHGFIPKEKTPPSRAAFTIYTKHEALSLCVGVYMCVCVCVAYLHLYITSQITQGNKLIGTEAHSIWCFVCSSEYKTALSRATKGQDCTLCIKETYNNTENRFYVHAISIIFIWFTVAHKNVFLKFPSRAYPLKGRKKDRQKEREKERKKE